MTKRKVIKIAFNAPSERKRRGRESEGSRRGRKRVATVNGGVLVLVVVIYMNRGGDVVAITCGVGYLHVCVCVACVCSKCLCV